MKDRIRINGVLYEAVGSLRENQYSRVWLNNSLLKTSNLSDGSYPEDYSGGSEGFRFIVTISGSFDEDYVNYWDSCGNFIFVNYPFDKRNRPKRSEAWDTFDDITHALRNSSTRVEVQKVMRKFLRKYDFRDRYDSKATRLEYRNRR